jgi:carboxyl-terminal processing protease
LLEQNHYLQRRLDDDISAKFLERYLDSLDNLRMHFLQSDLNEFAKYRTELDDLTRGGDTSPGRIIFARFLERYQQRAAYVAELLRENQFDFTGDDRYNLDRKNVLRPKDLAAAKEVWKQHLRYEILHEKLNKDPIEEITTKISKRYGRMLKALQDYDSDDVLESYLSALARVYDPHSDYMGRAQLENFAIGMKLSLFGIGAILREDDGYCKIVSLVPGPAEKSQQIKENDRIIAVAEGEGDPVDVVGMQLRKVVEKIRGAKGTEVRLTIIPADAEDPSVRKVVSLVRDEIKLEDQEAKAKIYEIPGESGEKRRIGLIDLPSFYANMFDSKSAEAKSTTVDVAKLLRKLKRENVDGVILDLRRNGGGSLEEAINLTGLFIKEGPVVQVRGPVGKPHVDRDEDPTVVYDGPLIVMTSRFSASASEILAGALQDYGRALVVGDNSTHGKGTVQSLVELGRYMRSDTGAPLNLGALKVTIRKFYRASGSSTQSKGVIPDIILPSVNNLAEVGEDSLENPLPWDTIDPAPYDRLDRIQPYLSQLKTQSAARIEADPDFAYIQEDMERYKKLQADRTVSLNKEERLREKEEAEARSKARQADLKARAEKGEKVYELTLKLADAPGLPEPMVQDVVQDEDTDAAENDEASSGLGENTHKQRPIDAALNEAKRILADFVAMIQEGAAIAGTAK